MCGSPCILVFCFEFYSPHFSILIKLYNKGGFRFINPASVATDEVWRFTGNETNWQQQLPLRQKRQFHSTVVIEGDIYHVGGYKDDPSEYLRLRFENLIIYMGSKCIPNIKSGTMVVSIRSFRIY